MVRMVTKIANPDPTNCPPSAINYSNILPATMDDGARIGGTNVPLLPATALQSENFTLTAIQQYFQKNPNASSYTVPLSWNTPLPFPLTYTVTDGQLQPVMGTVDGNQWIVGWTAVRTITAVIDPNCNSQVNWNHIWSQNLDLNTAQPIDLGAGVGGALPATAQNPLTIAQLNTLFGGTAGVQTMNLNWDFTPNPLGIVTFANNDSRITAGAPTATIIQQWVLFSIANPTAIFDFFGDTGATGVGPARENQAAWNFSYPTTDPTIFTNNGGTNLSSFTLGNRPTGVLLGNNKNRGTLMLWRAGSIANQFITSGIPNTRVRLNAGNVGGGLQVRIIIRR